MRKVVFVVAAVMATFAALPANADQCVRVGNTVYGNCYQQRVPQRHVLMPFTQQRVHGRPVVVLPPRHNYGMGGVPVSGRRSLDGNDAIPTNGGKYKEFLDECAGLGAPIRAIENGGRRCASSSRIERRYIYD